MTGIGRTTLIQRKSTPLGDVQRKGSEPIFYFVHFADDNYSKVKTEDEQSGIDLKLKVEIQMKYKGKKIAD